MVEWITKFEVLKLEVQCLQNLTIKLNAATAHRACSSYAYAIAFTVSICSLELTRTNKNSLSFAGAMNLNSKSYPNTSSRATAAIG